MIDWNRLDELSAEIGAKAVAEVVAMFLEEADHEIARLQADPAGPRIAASLHFLRGSALNLGLSDLARACTDGERALADGAPQKATTSVPQIYARSRQALLQGLAARTAA